MHIAISESMDYGLLIKSVGEKEAERIKSIYLTATPLKYIKNEDIIFSSVAK